MSAEVCSMPNTLTPESNTRPKQAWLIVAWLVCTLTVVGFALVSYFVGWFYDYME